VLLTDGQVGNEDEILRQALGARNKARVYSFGIGTNVSDALLRNLAQRTGGTVEFIHPGERIDEKVVAQFSRAVAARVTDVSLSFQGLEVGEFAPPEAPPLVDGEPWVLFARYGQPGRGTVEIRGSLRGEPFLLRVPLELPAWSERPHLPRLWAAERIRDLEVAVLTGRRAEAMKERITQLAVEHQIASRYTSFVVVEQRFGERRAHSQPETRVVPVNAPAGWDMFSRKEQAAKGMAAPVAALLSRTRGPGRPVPLAAAAKPLPASMPALAASPAFVPAAAALAPAPAPARSLQGHGLDGGEHLLSKKAKQASTRDSSVSPASGAKAEASFSESSFEAALASDEALSSDDMGFAAPLADAAVAPARSQLLPTPSGPGGDPVVALLGRQLANGLWDAPGPEPEGIRRVRATVQALLSLLREGVTTAHPLHGTQVKKAVEALLGEARTVASGQPALAELALGVAWLIASGRRTRGQIEQAVSSEQALQGLKPLFGDEGRMRQRVDALALTLESKQK